TGFAVDFEAEGAMVDDFMGGSTGGPQRAIARAFLQRTDRLAQDRSVMFSARRRRHFPPSGTIRGRAYRRRACKMSDRGRGRSAHSTIDRRPRHDWGDHRGENRASTAAKTEAPCPSLVRYAE